jgi:hypothetical protein
MAHIAHEGFLNPHDGGVLRHLIERGLVRRTPSFRLFSDDFRAFVLEAEAPRDLRLWEYERDSDWTRAQMPAVGALAVAAGFLFLTQPQLFDTGTGVATAAAGVVGVALPFLRQLASRDRGTHAA